MDAAAELGRSPESKHQIQLEYGDEQGDAGRDCRTRLARLNSQAQTGTRKKKKIPVQLTTSRIGNLTRLTLTLVICDDDDHTCMRPDSHTCFFSEYFCTVAIFSLYGEYVVRSFLPDDVFLPCDHGLSF